MHKVINKRHASVCSILTVNPSKLSGGRYNSSTKKKSFAETEILRQLSKPMLECQKSFIFKMKRLIGRDLRYCESKFKNYAQIGTLTKKASKLSQKERKQILLDKK